MSVKTSGFTRYRLFQPYYRIPAIRHLRCFLHLLCFLLWLLTELVALHLLTYINQYVRLIGPSPSGGASSMANLESP